MLEGLQTAEWKVQKIAVRSRNQRSYDVVTARDQRLKILLRVVALVEDQSDVLEILGQHAVALDQFFGDAYWDKPRVWPLAPKISAAKRLYSSIPVDNSFQS